MPRTNRTLRLAIAAGFFLSGVFFYIGQWETAVALMVGASMAIALS